MTEKKSKDVDKPLERQTMVTLVLYCHEALKLDNAQIGRIFRRERSDIKRIIDKNKPKGV